MLGDPISVTHNAVSRSLARVNQDNYSSEYLLNTGTQEFRVFVKHSNESVAKNSTLPAFERHAIEFRVTTFATPTTLQTEHVCSAVIRTRKASTPADALLAWKALAAYLSDANVSKLIGWES